MFLFEKQGFKNTEKVLELVKIKGEKLGIKTCVLPSSTGFTIEKAIEILSDFELIVVTLGAGYPKQFPEELKEKYEKKGVKFVKAAHAFGSIGRGVRQKFKTYQNDEIMAGTLKILGAGVKVAVEISLMATDAGLLDTEKNVIALGGVSQGVDSALILRPSHTHNFFETKIREIICKPALV